ncbi:MAG: Ykof family thiamine-binding protein [Actinobacteria bacterium]|nr:Ykof family thiamine-binding protein [Actinomycetota bacterium]
MKIQAELSLYPLFHQDVVSVVDNYIEQLKKYDIEVEVGEMSTRISGESSAVFEATRSAYEKVSADKKCILIAKFSNACIAELTKRTKEDP